MAEEATRKREGLCNLALPGHLPTKTIYPGFSSRRARELGDGVPVRYGKQGIVLRV